jgi:hypothetical protein
MSTFFAFNDTIWALTRAFEKKRWKNSFHSQFGRWYDEWTWVSKEIRIQCREWRKKLKTWSHVPSQLSVKLRCKVRFTQLLKNILVVVVHSSYYRNSLLPLLFLLVPFSVLIKHFSVFCLHDAMKANHFNNIKFLNHSNNFYYYSFRSFSSPQ